MVIICEDYVIHLSLSLAIMLLLHLISVVITSLLLFYSLHSAIVVVSVNFLCDTAVIAKLVYCMLSVRHRLVQCWG
jgi:hypothetical protein